MMKGTVKNEFQLSATPDEGMSRHPAYLAEQDSGSVLAGGFVKDGAGLDGGDERSGKQTARAIEFLTQQEQIRQQRVAELASRLDALELAARDALMDAENNLGDILSNANRDRMGRAVFMDEDGQLRDEDGGIVDPEAVDMSEWDSEGASYATFNQSLMQRDRAADVYERAGELQSRLDDQELENSDLSALADDLDLLETQISSLSLTEAAEEPEPAKTIPDNSDRTPTALSEPSLFKPM